MSIQQRLFAVEERDRWPAAELALLQAAKAGDSAALEQLLALHERPLLALCYGMLAHADDAEDAAQETFLRALRALPRFQTGRAAFRTWLFRIAVNVCLNWKRDRQRTEPWDEDEERFDALNAPSASRSPEEIALCRLEVTEALNGLPARHRAIFLLKVLEGWSAAEIAAAMGWNRIRVQNELSKARRSLAEWQARRDEEGGKP